MVLKPDVVHFFLRVATKCADRDGLLACSCVLEQHRQCYNCSPRRVPAPQTWDEGLVVSVRLRESCRSARAHHQLFRSPYRLLILWDQLQPRDGY